MTEDWGNHWPGRAVPQQDMVPVLAGHPEDVPALVDQLNRLQEILERVPPLLGANPIAAFNRVHSSVAEQVLQRIYAGGFADPGFLSRLTVELGARYFDALRAWGEGAAPAAWTALFRRARGAHGPDPLWSAAAGVIAQVNFDLPFALVTTFDHLGADPVDDSDQHADYRHLGEIFGASLPSLDGRSLQRWQLLVDAIIGDLDEDSRQESDEYARDVPWRRAQRLWAVRHDLQQLTHERVQLDGAAATVSALLASRFGEYFL
jgi:hypothetical protein